MARKSFASAVRSGDRMRLLHAQRQRLAEELDVIELGHNPAAVATLMRQMGSVTDRIAALEEPGAGAPVKGDPLDELAARRRDRSAGAQADGGRSRRLPGRR